MVSAVQVVSQAAPGLSHAAQVMSQAASAPALHAASAVAQTTVEAASNGWLDAPWAFWSGLIGSAVTAIVAIATLVLSNRMNLTRQAEQLKHDADQKREDRKLSIRREVYLEAIEQAHALLASIGGLTQRNLDTSTDSDALQAFLKSNAKIWLVADAEAAHLSRDLASEFSEFFLHALAASLPARVALEPVRVRAKQIEREEAEFVRLSAQFNDAKAKQGAHVEQVRLSALLAESGQMRTDLRRAQQDARNDAAPIAFESFRATFGQMRAVQRSLCALVSSLRHELDLPRDDDEFMAQLLHMERRAWAAVNKAFGIDPPGPMPEIAAGERCESISSEKSESAEPATSRDRHRSGLQH